MSELKAFYDAKAQFINSLEYTKLLSFEEWKEKPDDLKAAFLFVQFFNEIIFAWDKADSIDFGDDAEGVSTVLQYLGKQVKDIQYFRKDDPKKKASAEFRRNNPDGYFEKERRIIEENPSKFSSKYIYRVAYNCLYCICGHDRKCDKDIINNETSAIVMHNGEELNLFDSYVDNNSKVESIVSNNAFKKEFWDIIESEGASAEKVMRYLLSNNRSDLRALSASDKRYKDDPLRDVKVSIDDVQGIVEKLKEKFLSMSANSYCGQYISRMVSMPA